MANRADSGDGDDIERRRRRERENKARERAEKSVLTIPRCQDPERRALLEGDDVEWLQWYFGAGCGVDDPFTYQFTPQQSDMITSIGYALRNGGDQAIAASRGEGKTTVSERLTLKYVLQGACNYAVLFASTGPMAENILDAINTYVVENERLAADYPEVCIPVRELQGAPQRARSQRGNGRRHDDGEPYEMAELRYSWCGNELIFPDVPGSPSARAIIATRGLDAAVRGLKKRGKRPKLAIIDDPDTEDTARSEEQAKKLEKRIDAAIGGLGGQTLSIGRVVLTTLQSRIAVSYRLTDTKARPTFKGRRYRFMLTPPERQDLWDEYMQMRLDDLQQRDENGNDTDPEGRRSHRFYLEHRDAMDAGAVVSNPNRFSSRVLADGSQQEVSAIQHYYNLIVKLDKEVVATEYDNDPPEEQAITDSGLTPNRIQRQTSGYERMMVPPACVKLTCGVDVRKVALHWVVRGWRDDGTGFTIDYGVHEVRGTKYGSDDGVDEAIRKSVLEFHEQLMSAPYCETNGLLRQVDMMLVDAGWKTDAVYAACLEIGKGVLPVMGFGKSSGCTQANFTDAARSTNDKQMGDGWFLSNKGKIWLCAADADRWKSWEHDRWLTGPGKPGAMLIFGQGSESYVARMSDDEKGHHAYARHITNESEVEEMHNGTLRRKWKARSENTHWLDASYYANVAANIIGVRLQRSAVGVLVAKTAQQAARPRQAATVQPQQPAPQPRPQQQASSGGMRRLDMRRLNFRK